jgi:nitric oxide reductase NorQ protein
VSVSILEELIPEKSFADTYVGREVHGKHADLELLAWAQLTGDNVLIKGPTGPGKTMLCRAFCAKHQIPFVNINPGTAIEPSMLIGKEVLKSGSSYWVDGVLTAALRRGRCLVLFDELNFWPPGVTGFLHALLDDQRYMYLLDHLVEHINPTTGERQAMPEIVRAGEGTLFVAAYNPRYEGTFRPNQAFENRFAVQLRWGYSERVENALLSLPTLKTIAKELRRLHSTGEITVPVSTNKLMFFQRMADDLGLQAAIDNFVDYFDGTEREAVGNVMKLNRDKLFAEVRQETGRDPNIGRFVA